MLGTAAAFDAPARQTFVADMVGEDDLANAVALNSMTFNGARMVGSAAAGLLIGSVGTGWAFLFNGLSVRGGRLAAHAAPERTSPDAAGAAFTRKLRAGLALCLGPRRSARDARHAVPIGTFGMNFAIYTSTMAVRHSMRRGERHGMLSSMMAIRTITGALIAAGAAPVRPSRS